ncbi:FeoA domain protein [delta proteobacterium NaphS2]|nr:FeoA domain protein [delta proteobacterium NaphS2]
MHLSERPVFFSPGRNQRRDFRGLNKSEDCKKITNNGQPMKKTIKMREMLDNQKGVIKRVSATGDMGRRIREMGLVPETPIQIRGRAPLKDPVAVKIRDYVLTLRNNEASSILVEVEENPSNQTLNR